MSKRVPIPSAHDVADLAGVSQAAVSRAFTPGASISDNTRERVLKAAGKLGYRPNLLARSLTMGRSGIVGVVMGNPKNPSFAIALEALSRRLSEAGKHILIFTAEDEDCAADVHVEDLLKYRVDSLLLISAGLSSKLADRCLATGIPVVFFNRLRRKTKGTASVTGAHREGARKIGEHLLLQGYRRLAYMVGFSDSWTNRQRESGFFEYVASQGFPTPQRVIGHFQREGAMAAARSILSERDRPDAIFCASDYMALATIEVARYEFGITIGSELGVAGFDDVEQASWPSFDLTTYSQPVDKMIDHVVSVLLREPGAELTSHTIFEGTLQCRGSTRRTG